MYQTSKHKVFISFHHEDQHYKDLFVKMMEGDIVDKSVEDGDIDDTNLKTETIRQKIRDDFIADATVTVVLIGPCTWQRKHVDWEIGSSLRDTPKNHRCGLLGILLPNHPDSGKGIYHHRLIPPRLADNCRGIDPYVIIYGWSTINHLTPVWQTDDTLPWERSGTGLAGLGHGQVCGTNPRERSGAVSADAGNFEQVELRGAGLASLLRHKQSRQAACVRACIHRAFRRRNEAPPANGRQQFRHNRSGNCIAGWQE